MHDVAVHLDDEPYGEASKEVRVDVEEAGGHDALGLGGEELSPRWALSSGSRWETMAAEHGRHARLRHRDTELLQLTDDAEIAPPGIVLGQAPDQLHGFWDKLDDLVGGAGRSTACR